MKGGRKWVEPALSVPSMEVFCLGFVANHFDVMPARTNDMSLSHNGKPPLEQLRLSPKGRQFIASPWRPLRMHAHEPKVRSR